ncbi:uncharacterized protein LOC132307152 isoform X2 [Cornus florida]|uniref:uncharacterized protein LOC132307152 isoform X2 n=1 Tax=Cornus florida TaxID=4283 RepID=UPI00289AE90B|nr:uncharacterized protein LOC132307152 isoform X2 [Cornus florida]
MFESGTPTYTHTDREKRVSEWMYRERDLGRHETNSHLLTPPICVSQSSLSSSLTSITPFNLQPFSSPPIPRFLSPPLHLSASGYLKMSALDKPITDIEAGSGRHHRRRRRRRHSVAGSSETTTDGSLCFSDSDDDQSWHSPLYSTAGGSYDECGFSEIEGISDPHSHRVSSGSDCLSDGVDLESGDLALRVHSAKEERNCRICHLNLEGGNSGSQELGVAMELGCSCKDDLGAAHKQCAETWFKIKGNTTCEICGATALNIAGEQTNEANNTGATAVPTAPVISGETRSFWHGRRIMNFLLACMVFAFIISWLFHFNW